MKHVVNQTVEGSAAFDFCWSRSAAAGCPTLSSPGAVGWRCPNPSNVPWPRLWSESLWQRPSRSKAPSASCPWGATSVVVAQNGGAWAAAVHGSTWGTKVGHDDPCGSLPAWFQEGHHHPVNLTFFFLGGVKEQGLEWGTAASLLHAFRFVLENMASVSALSHPHLRQKNQAWCAGFAVVDIIYCALNKRCPKENENNVLQQQNMHNKEAIAYGFMGFPTPCSLPPYSFIVLS